MQTGDGQLITEQQEEPRKAAGQEGKDRVENDRKC